MIPEANKEEMAGSGTPVHAVHQVGDRPGSLRREWTGDGFGSDISRMSPLSPPEEPLSRKMWLQRVASEISAHIFTWNFYRSVVCWLFFVSLVGGGIFKAFSPQMKYIDCLFMVVSAVTTTGLATRSMLEVDDRSFIVIYISMFLGASSFWHLLVLIFRVNKKRIIEKEIRSYLQQDDITPEDRADLMNSLKKTEVQESACVAMMLIIGTHYFFSIFIATFVLYGIDVVAGYAEVQENVERGFSRLWVCAFLTMTCFTNAGFTLNSTNMVAYVQKPGLYLFMCYVILVGNTCAPVYYRFLAFMYHTASKKLPIGTKMKTGFRFLLVNPRAISYHMFDSMQTRVLLLITIAINSVEYIFFLGSTLPRDVDLGSIETRASIGFFQTVSTRNAGLNILDPRLLNRGMLIVYCITMYLSAAPLMRTMIVSEQQAKTVRARRKTAVDVYLHFQSSYLFRHSSMILVAILILAFSEDDQVSSTDKENLFDVIFEVISAYGNVGVSMGYPGEAFSLCGVFSDLGKFVIMGVMMMGKMRGLPTRTDIVIDFRYESIKQAMKSREEKEQDALDLQAELEDRLLETVNTLDETLWRRSMVLSRVESFRPVNLEAGDNESNGLQHYARSDSRVAPGSPLSLNSLSLRSRSSMSRSRPPLSMRRGFSAKVFLDDLRTALPEASQNGQALRSPGSQTAQAHDRENMRTAIDTTEALRLAVNSRTSMSRSPSKIPTPFEILSSTFFSVPSQARDQHMMPDSFYLESSEVLPPIERRPSAESFGRARSLPLPVQDEDEDIALDLPVISRVKTYNPRKASSLDMENSRYRPDL